MEALQVVEDGTLVEAGGGGGYVTIYTNTTLTNVELTDAMIYNTNMNEIGSITSNSSVSINRLIDDITNNIELEYIESTGTTGEQYISTGYLPNQDTCVEVRYKFTRDFISAIFGTRTSDYKNAFSTWLTDNENMSNKKLRMDYNDTTDVYTTNNIGNDIETIHTLLRQKNKSYVDGVLEVEHTYSSFSSLYDMYLFTANTGGFIKGSSCVRIYNFKIWDSEMDDGHLVRNYVPVYNKILNQSGLYDRVEGKFYRNIGTGSFVKGPRINN